MPLLSLFVTPLLWIFRTALVKATLFFSAYLMTGFGIALAVLFMDACCDLSLSYLTQIFNNVPEGAKWLWNVLNFGRGVRIIICSLVTAWMISWIPMKK